jgi:hypothetical protein
VKVALVVTLAALSIGVLWLAGEQHRKNCRSSGHSRCSVLPWNSGDRPVPMKLDERGCEQLRLANTYDGVQGDTFEVPPDCR